MDGERFDRLVKRLTQTRLTRSEALRGVFASAVVGLTVATRTDDSAAKKQGKQTKRDTAADKQGGNKQGGSKSGTTKQGRADKPPRKQRGPSRGGCRDNDQACQKNTQCCSGQCDHRLCVPRLGCTENDSECQQNSDCCTGNCFDFVCAAPVTQCGQGSGATPCTPAATGCCLFESCCPSPANQCNREGDCCAPNCQGRQCGPDGCGNEGTCGECLPGQTCSTNGKCQGKPTCSQETCPTGCCDKNGNCQPGNTEQACGTGGQACVNCPGSQTSCQNGQCRCSPQCQGKDCGPDGCGGSCGICPSGQVCNGQSGQCTPSAPCTAPFDNTCSCLAKVPGPGFACTMSSNIQLGSCSAANPACPAGQVCIFTPCVGGVVSCAPLCPSPAACTCDHAPEFCLSDFFVKCGNLTTSTNTGTSTVRSAATRSGRSIFPRTP